MDMDLVVQGGKSKEQAHVRNLYFASLLKQIVRK